MKKCTSTANLLIMNFAMDTSDPLLGFCTSWVDEVYKIHQEVVVLSGRSTVCQNQSSKPFIYSIGWRRNENIRNVFRFYSTLIKTLRENPGISHVFIHMATPYAVLAAPLLRWRHIRIVLWHAHPSPSRTLKVAEFCVDEIWTSAEGAAPPGTRKVRVLGQGIRVAEPAIYRSWTSQDSQIRKFVHIGRVDPIKRIERLITVIQEARKDSNLDLLLAIIGDATSESSIKYLTEIKDRFSSEVEAGWLTFLPSLSPSQVPERLIEHECFVHACLGAIDKATLEAADCGLVVLSENPLVLKALAIESETVDLKNQILKCLRMSPEEIKNLTERQKSIVRESHTAASRARDIVDMLVD